MSEMKKRSKQSRADGDRDEVDLLLSFATSESTKAKKRKVDPSYSASRVSDSNGDGSLDSGTDEREEHTSGALKPRPPTKRPGGVILKSGRIRLPDKMIEYLNKKVVPEVLYWHEDGETFFLDSKRAQTELLDKYFHGTKLSSFTRSLNRWGFKRIFHALLPKNVLSYEHPCFKREDPDLVKEMKMVSGSSGNQKDAENDSDQDQKMPAAQSGLPASVPVQVSATASYAPPVSAVAALASSLPAASYSPLAAPSGISASLEPQGMGMNSSLPPAWLQSLVDSQRSPPVEQLPSNGSVFPDLVALQALIASQQRTDMSRTLNLRQVDLPALIQTILAGQANQSMQHAAINVTQTQANPPILQFQVQLQPSAAAAPAPGLLAGPTNAAIPAVSENIRQALQAAFIARDQQQKQAAQQLLLDLVRRLNPDGN